MDHFERAHIFNGIFDESLLPLNSIRIARERVRRVVSGDANGVFNKEELRIKPEKPNVQRAGGTGQVSINHVKLGAGQGGQDVAATENFCISSKSGILPTQ